MKFKTLILIGILYLIPQFALGSQGSKLELGMILNHPDGVSFKYWMNEMLAIDGAISLLAGENFSQLYFHGDILVHKFERLEVQGGTLPIYFGIGGEVNLINFDSFGLRFPLGASYIYGDSVFSIFFELVPYLVITPNALFGTHGAMGFRLFL